MPTIDKFEWPRNLLEFRKNTCRSGWREQRIGFKFVINVRYGYNYVLIMLLQDSIN